MLYSTLFSNIIHIDICILEAKIIDIFKSERKYLKFKKKCDYFSFINFYLIFVFLAKLV